MQSKALSNIWRALALGALALVTLTHCGEGGTPSSSIVISGGPTPTPLLLTPPPSVMYLGAYVNPSQEPDPPPTLIAGLETQIGRRFALSLHYYGFYQAFPGPDEIADAAAGRIPVESWNCTPSNAAIVAGDADHWIRSVADAVKAFGYPVFIRYMYEMELPSTSRWRPECWDPKTDLPNGQFSPQEFIGAWDHIRAIFAQEGVGNVIWLWNPAGNKDLGEYYPGANEVDWTGMDRYDTGNVSVQDTYLAAYQLLRPIGKPIMIGETGAQLAEQPAFFQEMPSTLQQDFPLIRGIDFFDSSRKDNYYVGYSWVIEPSTLADFAAMAATPYFQGYQP
jgi:Glycosyl hydrolase family 26